MTTLRRQLYSNWSHAPTEAYEDCIKHPYAYLVVDMSPSAEDKQILRTRIFSDKNPVIYTYQQIYKKE